MLIFLFFQFHPNRNCLQTRAIPIHAVQTRCAKWWQTGLCARACQAFSRAMLADANRSVCKIANALFTWRAEIRNALTLALTIVELMPFVTSAITGQFAVAQEVTLVMHLSDVSRVSFMKYFLKICTIIMTAYFVQRCKLSTNHPTPATHHHAV